MDDLAARLARSREISVKAGKVLHKRTDVALERFRERVRSAYDREIGNTPASLLSPWQLWNDGYRYGLDFAQRSILYWDTLRQRGNAYLEHLEQGQPPLLHFGYEMLLDGRTFERPVNYALLRILPPPGVQVDPKRRPYLILDPRAGHGPGIGGFKDDSQVGVALRAGHPVYFVIFFREPEPGQTMLDVCRAEQRFVHKVRELHPDSPKPVLMGNCQGGWAAMMLSTSAPDDTGPVVINGAPMSYWSGAWQEGEGDNPMRYSGGLLGGTWLASLAADLGNGVFDGAWLVQNFENLNPANSYWDKYYHLFANIDTEPARFLGFERWWGGYFLMNREEIEWITRNLFVGNQLWNGSTPGSDGTAFDLRAIKEPIILFASLGDNITPPQQAFNWVADIYGSTEEIKARGQVIVGMLHQSIGHLGIFVSGRVAKKEHSQIVSVLKSIEMLTPGLYGMQIVEHKGENGTPEYEVEFQEHRLEEIMPRLNRLQRADEKAFEAVTAVSELNQRAYQIFAQPLVQACSNQHTAQLLREFHPLRVQHWGCSDRNPWLWWLAPAARAVEAQRQTLGREALPCRWERFAAECFSAALDHYRALRDAASETLFFQLYGSLYSLYLPAESKKTPQSQAPATESRELPFVREALAAIAEGGYNEAFARVSALLAHKGDLPLAHLETRQELARDYAEWLPGLEPSVWRRLRGEQEIIANFEPEQALATLPKLLADAKDRDRLLSLLQRLEQDERVLLQAPSAEQIAMLARIREVLGSPTSGQPSARPRKQSTRNRMEPPHDRG